MVDCAVALPEKEPERSGIVASFNVVFYKTIPLLVKRRLSVGCVDSSVHPTMRWPVVDGDKCRPSRCSCQLRAGSPQPSSGSADGSPRLDPAFCVPAETQSTLCRAGEV